MGWRRKLGQAIAACAAGVLVIGSWWAAGAQTTSAPDYERDIAPLFKKRCVACHGPATQMNGLRLDSGEEVLKGSLAGKVVIPGKAGESSLIARVESEQKGVVMPPSGPRLTAEEIATLRAWIDSGARIPQRAAEAKKQEPREPQHWSFREVKKPAVPGVAHREWVRNPIDAFILEKLEREGVAPSPEAPKTTLLRRLHLDLTGLPPTPAEVKAFLQDNRPDAYERKVEQLLASPHYGEKWARFWLDLARYADSDGYEKDNARRYAWRYRHWVIEAFNRDLPYDQFTIEQLAGDLLPQPGVEQLVATGFHRNTLTNREAGVDRAEARFEQVVDRTNTLGTVFLGLTVGCAQCHNHKYDPISQKEYYQLFAFFDNAEEVDIEAPLPGQRGPYLSARPAYYASRQKILDEYGVPALQAQWEKKLIQAMDDPGKELDWDFHVTSMRAMLDHAERMLRTPPEQRSQQEIDRLTDYFVRNPGPDFAKQKEVTEKLKQAREKLTELARTFPALPEAPAMRESPHRQPTHIRLKGDYRAKGLPVEPDVPSVLPPLPAQAPRNRLTLAKWLTDPRHPLFARVAVNRFWQEIFGRGIVRTSEDFGTQGEAPSHPELLDWLAAEFVEQGYSVKQLLRTIVTSATYRQSSGARSELRQRDPDNVWLARQNRLRLTAELIRDNALAVSGLLNPRIGGESVRPPIPKGVVELSYGGSVKWEETQGPDRYRRGMYILFQRTVPYPQLMNFDAPDANVACSRRRRSNTPLQALNLLNDPVFMEAAQAMALRVVSEQPGTLEDRLGYAFLLALGRTPTSRERERLQAYYNRQLQILEKEPESVAQLAPNTSPGMSAREQAAWVGVCRVLLNLDEFIVRE